ncbi:cupin domain-containing protein [Streptococcus sp. zg-JUN1979]|uniref:cupin domain-containing protein n=1 Tax=Streptococcus sp. zg-JUN1979 TaxID=3391450 RepID=UPI0039A570D3
MKYYQESDFEKVNVFGLGAKNDAYAKYFKGQSYLNPLGVTKAKDFALANVTFEPSCRNNWHIHKASQGGGQVLICTAGEGWYQEEGKEAISLTEGSVIIIPANVKHWHGAKADSWFSHIAFELAGEDRETVWLEEVSDQDYQAL